VIDHGHNDRPLPPITNGSTLGSFNPAAIDILSIRKGVTTEIVLQHGHGLSAFDDLTIRTPGITSMDYWTGEVLDVHGDSITIQLDTSHIEGTYTAGGSAIRYDKSRLYDAYNLIISDIHHMHALHGGTPPVIILMTPPTEWTGGRNDGSIAAINQAIHRVAGKWELPVYDMTHDLGINAGNLTVHLPDRVHPTTSTSRRFIAAHIVDWASGDSDGPSRCK